MCLHSHIHLLVTLISGHRDLACACHFELASSSQINAHDFVHFFHFLVARLPIQHGGRADISTSYLAEMHQKKT